MVFEPARPRQRPIIKIYALCGLKSGASHKSECKTLWHKLETGGKFRLDFTSDIYRLFPAALPNKCPNHLHEARLDYSGVVRDIMFKFVELLKERILALVE